MILSKKEIEEIIAILKLEYTFECKDSSYDGDKLDINHCVKMMDDKFREEFLAPDLSRFLTRFSNEQIIEQIIKHLFTRHPKIIKHMPEEIKNKIILILL